MAILSKLREDFKMDITERDLQDLERVFELVPREGINLLMFRAYTPEFNDGDECLPIFEHWVPTPNSYQEILSCVGNGGSIIQFLTQLGHDTEIELDPEFNIEYQFHSFLTKFEPFNTGLRSQWDLPVNAADAIRNLLEKELGTNFEGFIIFNPSQVYRNTEIGRDYYIPELNAIIYATEYDCGY